MNHLLLLSVIENNCLGLVSAFGRHTLQPWWNCLVVMVTCHFPLTFPRCSSLTITVTVVLFSQMPSFFIGFIVLSEDRMNAIMEFKMTDNIINVSNWEGLWRQVKTILNELLHLSTAQRFHAKIRVSLSSFCLSCKVAPPRLTLPWAGDSSRGVSGLPTCSTPPWPHDR